MRKYALVQKMVNQLTDDPTFRTFFTLYLMAKNDVERQALNKQFWQDASELSEPELHALRASFADNFKKLVKITTELHERAVSKSLAIAA